MTGSSSCPRLLPLLACRRPGQLYSVSRVSSPAASAACVRSISGHAASLSIQRRRPRILYPSLYVTASATPGHTQRRGKKTTTFKFNELPQALVKAEPLPELEEDGLPAYPNVILQVRRNMQRFENCVLLTRIGGFYELYFEHAEDYAPMLGLKMAIKKTNAGPVSMAGFPFFQLERYLKALVMDLKCYVAVAEEFPHDPGDRVKAGGRSHDRRVTRVITPGTLIDEEFIDPYSNNYVLSIHIDHDLSQPSLTDADIDKPAVSDEQLDLADTPVGLAWVDVSTGQFYTQDTTVASLPSILSRVGPREIVVDEALQSHKDHHLFSVLTEDKHFITYARHSEFLPIAEWSDMLESEMTEDKIAQFSSNEAQAGSILLQYVKTRLLELSIKLQAPLQYENMAILTLDKNTMRALEIKQTIRDGVFRGSLLHAVRRTVTNGGARLLNSWLTAPSTCLDTIQERQDLVEYFIQNEKIRNDVVLLLKRGYDSQRLVQKFAFGRGDADDLLRLANTIRATQDIVTILSHISGLELPTGKKKRGKPRKKKIQDVDVDVSTPSASCFAPLLSRITLEDPVKLADRIRDSIDEEGLVQQRRDEEDEASQFVNMARDIVAAEGEQSDAVVLPKSSKKKKPPSIRDHYAEDNMAFVMKPQASAALEKLHHDLSSLFQEKVEMESSLRESLSAPSLTLRWMPQIGHVGHVKGKDTKNMRLTEHTAVSSSRSTRTVHIGEWTALGQRIHQIRFEINIEESRIFASLRAAVITNLVKLRRNALVLDEIDVTTSFAHLAIEKGFTRPILNNSTAHTIIGGRHPTVEGGLQEQGRSFTRNDCLVGHTSMVPIGDTGLSPAPSTEGRLWLITGPNMAGKSTYLRQNALITILAQAGCYVPATHATLGIVDAVYSRVGSADNLYRDQSTFMVEMLETAQILRQATPRSFVIMDEIGRGTTPEDGVAVAFACLHHLATVNQCRALFATHFHRIVDLVHEHGLHVEGGNGGPVETYCTDVVEDGTGGFVYVHKLRKGVNRKSHALKVARLSGLPDATLALAQDILTGDRLLA